MAAAAAAARLIPGPDWNTTFTQRDQTGRLLAPAR